MKKLFAVFAILLILLAVCSLICVPALADGDDYEYDDYDSDFLIGSKFSKVLGEVFIVLLGYLMPLFLIIFSLIKFLKSSNPRKNAWFIMTGVGLATAVLATVLILITL